MHTLESLQKDLINLELTRKDTLLVHSSMKAIGEVVGRADTVLDALMTYLGPEGLLVFPTLSWSKVNAEQPVYSVRHTPVVTGILPELFRQRPGVHRSLHPTHSLAAFGQDAETFIAGHEAFSTPCARKSPWGKLYDRQAKILFIGTSIAHNTLLHAVEEWGNADEIFKETQQQLFVIDENNRKISVPSFRHNGGHSQFYDRLAAHFEAAGALSKGHFGDAQCFLLDARKAADITLEILKKYPAAFTVPWNDAHPDFWNSSSAF